MQRKVKWTKFNFSNPFFPGPCYSLGMHSANVMSGAHFSHSLAVQASFIVFFSSLPFLLALILVVFLASINTTSTYDFGGIVFVVTLTWAYCKRDTYSVCLHHSNYCCHSRGWIFEPWNESYWLLMHDWRNVWLRDARWALFKCEDSAFTICGWLVELM